MKKEFYLQITKIEQETSDIVNLYFQKPDSFSYNSGDCIDILLSDRTLGKKTFSFASSPLDQDLFITYKKGISTYKKFLESLRVGDKVECTHYGSNFIYHPGKKSIFIAGGVGITPLRSMVRTSVLLNIKEQMIVLYLNNSDEFAFQDELLSWVGQYSNLKCFFINSSIKGRISEEMLQRIIPEVKKESFDFYISGPPLMVDLATQIIDGLGLTNHIIHTDSFDGYTKELE